MAEMYVTLLEGFLVPRCYIRSSLAKQEELRAWLLSQTGELDFDHIRESAVEINGIDSELYYPDVGS